MEAHVRLDRRAIGDEHGVRRLHDLGRPKPSTRYIFLNRAYVSLQENNTEIGRFRQNFGEISVGNRALIGTKREIRRRLAFAKGRAQQSQQGEVGMIELVIAACVVTATECREFKLLYDPYDVSVMTCMIAGQPEVARWQGKHPEWQVTRWRCDLQDRQSSSL